MKNKLIAIDGSTQKSGIAYFMCEKFISCDLLDFSKNKIIVSRFNTMSKGLWKTLNEYKPNIVYMEETYTSRNPQTAKFLTRLQGIVYSWCMNNECEFHTIAPAKWRKTLKFKQGGNVKREQLKKQSIDYVWETYKIEVDDDQADAVCIGDAAIKIMIKERNLIA